MSILAGAGATMSDPAMSLVFWRQLGVAALCGGVVGLERQLHGKAMGLRTGVLICVATAVFVMLGAQTAGDQGDPSRVVGQVVVGVGFLGGGVIFNKGQMVQGLTSAAIIWLLAAIGSLAGLGLVLSPLLLAFAAVAMVAGMERLERVVPALRKGAHATPEDVKAAAELRASTTARADSHTKPS